MAIRSMRKANNTHKSNPFHKTFSSKNMHFIIMLLLFSLLPYFISGCALFNLKKQVVILSDSTILAGNISSVSPLNMPVVVVAYSKYMNKRTVAHYTVLHEPGYYELMVPKGNYYIFAFGDRNGNLIYEAGEPSGQYISPEHVPAPGGGVVQNLDIVISDKGRAKVDFPIGSPISQVRPEKLHSTLPGAIADLDDEIFSDEYGKKGYWAPTEFIKEVGGNIYFLKEYDPHKIPVLFVHGAAGSPQDWRYFFENIDLDRYQPWFFYYPSGASLKSMSHLLLRKLFNLQIKYQFKELYITAHSTGGLIVRSFLEDFGEYFPQINLFISISTPWTGEKFAESGVKYSPAVVPSWKDLQPEGEFIKSLFLKKIPPKVDYYLFFGHKGNRNPLRSNNDSAVTLASQLDLRPQSEAKMIYGFNEDHISILSSKDVLAQYNAILSSIYKGPGDNALHAGGNLRVHFSFDYPPDKPMPQLLLLLRPSDKDKDEIILYLNPGDSGRELGPFPPGDYNIRMIASAFKTEPARVPLTIKTGKIPSVKFTFKPQGILSGYIAAKSASGDNPAGMYLLPDEKVKIHSITLTGAGVSRTIAPLKEEGGNYYDYYLSGQDFIQKAIFCFFGLPGGEYELSIKAEGYELYTIKHNVIPGQFSDFQIINLTPSRSVP